MGYWGYEPGSSRAQIPPTIPDPEAEPSEPADYSWFVVGAVVLIIILAVIF